MSRLSSRSGWASLILGFLGWVWCAGLANAADSPTMKAGLAEADITPEPGMEKPGGYGKAYNKEVHDPCKVRVAVFDDGNMRVALVGVDALVVRRPLVEAARKRICERCGIRPEAILIGASHSHSSGPTGMILPGEFDQASEFVRKLAYEKSSCADAKYLTHVENQIVEAVCRADANRGAARCGVGVGVENQVAYNRRHRMKNGLSYTHPGQGNPDMLDYAGPTDPQVGVIGVWDAKGEKLLGCVVNYACHATCSPGGTSANWIYYMEQVIRGAMNPEAIVVFLQGACGDVTQVDNLSPYVRLPGERWSQLVGGRIGAEAVKVLLSMEPGTLTPLDAKVKCWDIARRKPSSDHVKQAMELVQKDPKQVGSTEWTFAKETVLLDALVAKEPVKKGVEVQAIQVGPVVMLTNPAEYFCQFGLDIKAGSPFRFTFPVELANDCVGYVPTEEAFGPHGGGYETRLTSYSNLEPTAGRQMAEAAIELAKQMRPGAVPERAKAPVAKEAWGYGRVPPELD